MIAQFALRLICGMSLIWCLMPRRQVTTGFFRIQMLVVLGLSVLAGLTANAPLALPESDTAARTSGMTTVYVLLAISAFVGSVVWTLGRRRAGDGFVFLIAALSGGAILYSAWQPQTQTTTLALLRPFCEYSSALLAGGYVTGMLLGHWYLTAPTMSIAPLSRVNVYLGAAGVIRLVLSAVVLSLAWDRLGEMAHWVWLSLRWLAGILGPIVMAFLVSRILVYRNTQSATGVLFAGVVLVFMGEFSALLLDRELGIPF